MLKIIASHLTLILPFPEGRKLHVPSIFTSGSSTYISGRWSFFYWFHMFNPIAKKQVVYPITHKCTLGQMEEDNITKLTLKEGHNERPYRDPGATIPTHLDSQLSGQPMGSQGLGL